MSIFLFYENNTIFIEEFQTNKLGIYMDGFIWIQFVFLIYIYLIYRQ